jgi:hypothetical protein
VIFAHRPRWVWLLAVGVAGCVQSTWERHQTALHKDIASGAWKAAKAEQQWMINNATLQAPVEERTREAEGARFLRLAKLAAKAGDTRTAVQALRDALTVDPSQASAIRAQLDALPLSPAEEARVKAEFAWNIAALAPADEAPQAAPADAACWSYRVREVRIRQRHTMRTTNGMERQVTYDAREWVYDAETHRWSADGGWVIDIGAETEPVDGPQRPRYQALVTAAHQFYADGAVPPCHRQAWRGPFDSDGTVFVAKKLPAT